VARAAAPPAPAALSGRGWPLPSDLPPVPPPAAFRAAGGAGAPATGPLRYPPGAPAVRTDWGRAAKLIAPPPPPVRPPPPNAGAPAAPRALPSAAPLPPPAPARVARVTGHAAHATPLRAGAPPPAALSEHRTPPRGCAGAPHPVEPRPGTSPGLAAPASAGVVRIQSAAQMVRILPRPQTVQLENV
jgi:hypothetical protein